MTALSTFPAFVYRQAGQEWVALDDSVDSTQLLCVALYRHAGPVYQFVVSGADERVLVNVKLEPGKVQWSRGRADSGDFYTFAVGGGHVYGVRLCESAGGRDKLKEFGRAVRGLSTSGGGTASPVKKKNKKKASTTTTTTSRTSTSAAAAAAAAAADGSRATPAEQAVVLQTEALGPLVDHLQAECPSLTRDQSIACAQLAFEWFRSGQCGSPAVGRMLERWLAGDADQPGAGQRRTAPANDDEDADGDLVASLIQSFRAIQRLDDDYQQQSWQAYDNEGQVLGSLDLFSGRINEALGSSDAQVERAALDAVDSFKMLDTLLSFYEHERRVAPRRVLLNILGSLGAAVPGAYGRMNARLPALLAEGLLSGAMAAGHGALAEDQSLEPWQREYDDAEFLSLSCLVLACLFANPELVVPFEQRQAVVHGTVQTALLDLLEAGRGDDDEFATACLGALLAVNMQFPPLSRAAVADDDTMNPLFVVLAERDETANFTLLLLSMFNRADDRFNYGPCVKLVRDLLLHPTLHAFFYTNDLRVIVDVTIRQLLDTEPTNPMRVHYFHILFGVRKYCGEFLGPDYKRSEMDDLVNDAVNHSLEFPDIADVAGDILLL